MTCQCYLDLIHPSFKRRKQISFLNHLVRVTSLAFIIFCAICATISTKIVIYILAKSHLSCSIKIMSFLDFSFVSLAVSRVLDTTQSPAPALIEVMWSNPGKVPFAWIPSHHKLSKWPIKRVQTLGWQTLSSHSHTGCLKISSIKIVIQDSRLEIKCQVLLS